MSLASFFTLNLLLGGWCIQSAHQILGLKRFNRINRLVRRNLHSPKLIAPDTAKFFIVVGATLIILPFLFLIPSRFSDLSFRGFLCFDVLLTPVALIWKEVIVRRYFDRGGKENFNPANIQNGKRRVELEIMNRLRSGKILNALLIKGGFGEQIDRVEGKLSLQGTSIELRMLVFAKLGQESETICVFSTYGELVHYLEKSTLLRVGDFQCQF